MDYPGRIIVVGETSTTIVNAIADRLRALGFPITSPRGVFDAALRSSVKLFQARQVDANSNPLQIDGKVGPITWARLFGLPLPTPGRNGLAEAAMRFALAEVGVREDPDRPNRGPRVDEYLRSTGTALGSFWCMAFIFFCFRETARAMGADNPFPKTAGCLDAWNRSRNVRITRRQAIANPSLVVPGSVFILDLGGGAGHTGFVESSVGGALTTVEGNTNNDGSSNGIGVFRLSRRNVVGASLKGFIVLP